jgi:NAD(P)-dependent dehydrogenase (short-subunit alcohol dehydrogenase family)
LPASSRTRATPSTSARTTLCEERAVEEIGGDSRLLVLDVTDKASIADAARRAGALDILVNNAGISGDAKTPDQEDAGTFRRINETNVFGVVAVTNAFLPALRRSAHPGS